MMQVWKKTLLVGVNYCSLPEGAEVLHVAGQNGITFWFRCNVYAPATMRKIIVAGTGHQLQDDAGKFLGTAMVDDYVWHVFEGAMP